MLVRFGFNPVAFRKRDDGAIEFRIAVQDHVTVWASFRKGLAQLLHDPLRARMSSEVEM